MVLVIGSEEEGDCPPLFSAKLLLAQTVWSKRKGMEREHKLWEMCSGEVLGNWDCPEQGEARSVMAASTKCGNNILEPV